MLNYSVLVAGLARDCAASLRETLKRLDAMSDSFLSVEYVVVTNDSNDNTAYLLREWSHQRTNVAIICLDGLARALPHRTVRLSVARNVYILELRRHITPADLLMVADLDGVNSNLILGNEFEQAITRAPKEWGALFANQRSAYYDIWALRHSIWSPADCWAQVWVKPKLFFRRRRLKNTIAEKVWSKQVLIDPSEGPIEVESAFGGFGIYRTCYLENAWYGGVNKGGNEVCEHVAFNAAVRRNGGKLFILPWLLNDAPEEHLSPGDSGGAAKPWLADR